MEKMAPRYFQWMTIKKTDSRGDAETQRMQVE
jgi:hypothetical protein